MACSTLFLLSAVLLVCSCASSSSWPLTVNTQYGEIEGLAEPKFGVNMWLGIPFAQPPVGSLRWKPPQPAQSWSGTLKTHNFSAACTQTFPAGYTFRPDQPISEDCLYLNVFAPSTPAPNKPVMVWIYGGALHHGCNAELRLNGTRLAQQGVVVVAINYRLGAMGFLALPQLSAESSTHPTSGNYGLLDQRLALQWVQRNIASFGGDASQVTMMGESAGATSTTLHLVMPDSFGLYHRAIIESSAYISETAPIVALESEGAMFAGIVGCSGANTGVDLGCLREVPWPTLVKQWKIAMGRNGTRAAIDGRIILEPPYHSFTSGRFNAVPTIIGDVANEGTIFIYPVFTQPLSVAGYEEYILQGEYAAYTSELMQMYPCNSSDCRAVLATAFGDAALACPTTLLANSISASGVPTYAYEFSHHPSWMPAVLGAYHTSEIQFVFDTVFFQTPAALPAEVALAKRMSAYWASFGLRATPNHATQPEVWPLYKKHNGYRRVVFNTPADSYEHRYLEDICQGFWAKVYADQGR